jgi:Mg-chelatase subunit ChlD
VNPESPQSPRDELEARLTALLLGELSAGEAAALRETIARDPDLRRLHDRLKLALELVREASAGGLPSAGGFQPPSEPLTLATERRGKLLALFQQPAPAKIIQPVAFWTRQRREWLQLAAMIVALMCLTVEIMFRKFGNPFVLMDQLGSDHEGGSPPAALASAGQVNTELSAAEIDRLKEQSGFVGDPQWAGVLERPPAAHSVTVQTVTPSKESVVERNRAAFLNPEGKPGADGKANFDAAMLETTARLTRKLEFNNETAAETAHPRVFVTNSTILGLAVQDGERAGVAQRKIAAIALPESLETLADNKQAYFENASGVVAGKDIGGPMNLGEEFRWGRTAGGGMGNAAVVKDPAAATPATEFAAAGAGAHSRAPAQQQMFRSGGMGGGGGGFGGVAGGAGTVQTGQAGAKAVAGAEFDGRTAGGDAGGRDLAEKSQPRTEPALAASGKPAGGTSIGQVQLGLAAKDSAGVHYGYAVVDGHKGDLKPGAAPQTAVRAGERLAAQNVELQTAESLSKSKVLADNRAFSMNPVAADVSPLHLTPGQNQSRLTSAATAQGEGERGVKFHMDLNRNGVFQSTDGLAVQDARRKDNTWSYEPSDPAPAGATPPPPVAEVKLRNLEDKLERATTLDRESGARADTALGAKVDSLAALPAPARAAKPASPAGSAAAGDKLAEITDLDMIVPEATPAPSAPPVPLVTGGLRMDAGLQPNSPPTLGRAYKAPAPNASQGGHWTIRADDSLGIHNLNYDARPPQYSAASPTGNLRGLPTQTPPPPAATPRDYVFAAGNRGGSDQANQQGIAVGRTNGSAGGVAVAPGTFGVNGRSRAWAPTQGLERAKEANITVQRSGGAVGGATVNFYALDGTAVASNPVPAKPQATDPSGHGTFVAGVQAGSTIAAPITDFDSDGAVKARVEGFDAPMDRFKEAQVEGRGRMPVGEQSAGAIQFGSGKYEAGKEVKLAEGQIQLMNKRTLEEAIASATNGFGSGTLYGVDSTAAGRVDGERAGRGVMVEALKREMPAAEPESRRLARIELPGLAEADKEVKAATTARGNLGDVQELAKLTAEPRQLMAERESLEAGAMEKKLKQVEQLVEEHKRDEMQRNRVSEVEQAWRVPNEYNRTNTVETSTRNSQETLKAFDRITLKEFGPFDRVPLSQVIEHLNAESKKLDPEKKGLNLVLDSLPASLPGGEQVPLGDVKVTIESSLMDLPLAYALDAVSKSADKRLQFKVEDNGVVFSASKDTTPQLFTRTFKVDPKTFAQGAKSLVEAPLAGPSQYDLRGGGMGGGGGMGVFSSGGFTNTAMASELIRQYLIAAGVNLKTNASGQSPMVFYNDRNGTLMVRASRQDLDAIQRTIEVLRVKEPEPPAPPKVAPPNAPIPQPEVSATENAFSTFSLNVSDVSFKLAQASLEKGVMPDVTTVRSEEFINAFNYHDPEPSGHAPIAFAWERARYPFAHDRDLLRFSVKTAASGRQANRPLNLVLLLDNSGSMERADRVLIRQECLRVLAGQLQPQDRISVVAFARTPRLWVDGLAGGQTEELMRRVGGLAPEGGTNLEDAMNVAYQTALKHFLPNGVNRVVLLTDGAANLGDVEPESLKKKVEAQRKQGVALDCFGIGWDGYNDDLLEALSRNGDGRYGFVNTPLAAATEFAGQLAGALKVAASDVKVQVEWNPKRVTTWRQIGYAKHQLKKEQFRDNTVDAAEIAAQEAGNALYTVQVNPRGEGPIGTVRVRFKVPGTNDYREHEWAVPYEGAAKPLEQAGATIRLAATASAFSEWLVTSPFAAEVKPDRLLAYLAGVPEQYAADPRPKQLEWMIRQAKSVAGQ